ncbi:MAG: hypothetical protein KJ964_03195 [Verrucomicrobia bacterium]|nr:hypothetical protein [Verrucomicrobiota bacterium]MBU1734645.1 hypothetical protein [Verrucomicrobiota bacterium]MBU1855363.1 hypothetical protein [Verrucomicrobiota bacterium]
MNRIVKLANDYLTVFVDPQKQGAITVEDRRSRHRWASGNALFTVKAHDLGCDRPYTPEIDKFHIGLEYHSGSEFGLSVKCDDAGIRFLVRFILDKDMLKVSIPYDDVVESKKQSFALMSVELMPCGFAARTGEEGYLLLPNFSGLVSRFKRREPQQYRSLLYVPQPQWEDVTVLPVFGAVHGKAAYAVIIESGDFDAGIVASFNWDERQSNAIHPEFHYRHHHTDMVDPVDRVISYHFLSGSDAGYVGMAKRYREYLIKTKGVLPLRDKAAVSRKAAYMCEAYGFLKIFCACKEKLSDGSVQYRAYTTFAEALQILKRLKQEGLEKIRCILVGWNWDGHDGRYPTRFPVDQRLGGEAGLKQLITAASAMDYQVTFHDNYSDAYRISPDWDESIMIRDQQGHLHPGGVWAGGQSYFPCPQLAAKRFMHRDFPRIKAMGVNGWYYLDGTPRALRGCYDKTHGHPLTRRAEGEGIIDQFQTVRAFFGGCSVEMPTAFVLPAVDEVSHIPCFGVWPLRPEFKSLVDEVTPFFHIAVHGLIIYHLMGWSAYPKLFGSVINGILKEIEWGAMPRNEVTFRPSSFGDFQDHIGWMKKEYAWICKGLGALQKEFIESHRRVKDNVFETVYSNGTRVLVNYGNKSVSVGRKTVHAKSHAVVK